MNQVGLGALSGGIVLATSQYMGVPSLYGVMMGLFTGAITMQYCKAPEQEETVKPAKETIKNIQILLESSREKQTTAAQWKKVQGWSRETDCAMQRIEAYVEEAEKLFKEGTKEGKEADPVVAKKLQKILSSIQKEFSIVEKGAALAIEAKETEAYLTFAKTQIQSVLSHVEKRFSESKKEIGTGRKENIRQLVEHRLTEAEHVQEDVKKKAAVIEQTILEITKCMQENEVLSKDLFKQIREGKQQISCLLGAGQQEMSECFARVAQAQEASDLEMQVDAVVQTKNQEIARELLQAHFDLFLSELNQVASLERVAENREKIDWLVDHIQELSVVLGAKETEVYFSEIRHLLQDYLSCREAELACKEDKGSEERDTKLLAKREAALSELTSFLINLVGIDPLQKRPDVETGLVLKENFLKIMKALPELDSTDRKPTEEETAALKRIEDFTREETPLGDAVCEVLQTILVQVGNPSRDKASQYTEEELDKVRQSTRRKILIFLSSVLPSTNPVVQRAEIQREVAEFIQEKRNEMKTKKHGCYLTLFSSAEEKLDRDVLQQTGKLIRQVEKDTYQKIQSIRKEASLPPQEIEHRITQLKTELKEHQEMVFNSCKAHFSKRV